MEDFEKADEISRNPAKYGDFDKENEIRLQRYNSAMLMADWKDKQFDEEKKELLGLVNMLPIDETNQTIIEDLKALLL